MNVFPGGSYKVLAIDLEGTEVCDWPAFRGITAVLFKYRVPDSGPHWDERCKCPMDARWPELVEAWLGTIGMTSENVR